MTNPLCCGTPAEYFDNVKTDEGNPGVGYYCQVCGNKSSHEEPETAKKIFLENAKEEPKKETKAPKKETKPKMSNTTQIATVNKGNVMNLFKDQNKLMKIVSPIIDRETGAMERLIENNLRYVESLKGKGYDRLWETDEGQASIIRETEEAFMLGLEMGKAGDIVPFGDDCKFIPDVEGVKFALTHGNNAPFKWIEIDVAYEGDDVHSGRKTGNFFVDFNSMAEDRTVVKAVYVYGLDKSTGLIKGEKYDAQRLLEKAREHSDPYKNYMKKMDAYEFAKSEGRVKKDANGREFFTYFVIKDQSNNKYFEQEVEEFKKQEDAGTLIGSGSSQYAVQVLPKKGGGTWEKKIYRRDIEGGMEEKIIYPDDLKNPYAGPDQAEMLMKTGGKSFLNKFLRTRTSTAAMNEARTHESVRDQAMNMTDDIVGVSEEV